MRLQACLAAHALLLLVTAGFLFTRWDATGVPLLATAAACGFFAAAIWRPWARQCRGHGATLWRAMAFCTVALTAQSLPVAIAFAVEGLRSAQARDSSLAAPAVTSIVDQGAGCVLLAALAALSLGRRCVACSYAAAASKQRSGGSTDARVDVQAEPNAPRVGPGDYDSAQLVHIATPLKQVNAAHGGYTVPRTTSSLYSGVPTGTAISVLSFEMGPAQQLQPTSLTTALDVALDDMRRRKQHFLGRYEVLGAVERRAGGQGFVQFVGLPGAARHFALKVRRARLAVACWQAPCRFVSTLHHMYRAHASKQAARRHCCAKQTALDLPSAASSPATLCPAPGARMQSAGLACCDRSCRCVNTHAVLLRARGICR